MFKLSVLAAASAVLLAACSTAVKETPTSGVAAAGPISVQGVKGQASAANTPGDLIPRLTQAIQGEVGHGPAGARAANLEFNVVDYKEVSGAARALGGMLGGSNRLHVAVTVRDAGGAVLRQFDVDRKSNPGALGAITDQEAGLINTTAKAIAQTLAK